MLLRAPGSSQSWAPKCPWAHSSCLLPPSQRPPRVQEGSQEPGSQEAAESAAQGPRSRPGQKGMGSGCRAEAGGQVPTCYSSRGAPWVWTCPEGRPPGQGGASTVSPPPPPQPFPRRRNQGGGARPAGLGARLQLETLLLPLLPQEGWELLVRGSSFESLKRLPWAKPQAGLTTCTSVAISPSTLSRMRRRNI